MKISASDISTIEEDGALKALKEIANECSMRPVTAQTNAGIDESVSAEQWEEKIIKIRKIAMRAIRTEMAKGKQ